MSLTVARIAWLQLRRSPVELLVVFAVPIIFFSIFAIIFGGQSTQDVTSSVDLVVVDEDGSEYSRSLVEALRQEAGLDISRSQTADGAPLDRTAAIELVRAGTVPVAVVLPAGLGDNFPSFGGPQATAKIFADPSDPVAPQVVSGLLQKVAMTAMPTKMIVGGAEQIESAIGGMSEEQRKNMDVWLEQIEGFMAEDADGGGAAAPAFSGMLGVEVENVLGERGIDNPLVSFYAAAIAVMFLLFSASGAGGSLLEEEESQTLERLLSTRLTMGRMLAGKWIFLTTMGIAQVVVMFLWGWAVFDLDLFGHLPGFAVMTLVTASAASGFGLVLATLCRTRSQLSGISTIVILSMSAIGGSMFPRFLMSDTMQRFGLLTFNAWAIDGYTKVFWRQAAVEKLLALSDRAAVGRNITGSDGDGGAMELLPGKSEAEPACCAQKEEVNAIVDHLVLELNENQRTVVERRFGLHGYHRSTLEEISKDIGVTRERVRQIQLAALSNLRSMMESRGASSEVMLE